MSRCRARSQLTHRNRCMPGGQARCPTNTGFSLDTEGNEPGSGGSTGNARVRGQAGAGRPGRGRGVCLSSSVRIALPIHVYTHDLHLSTSTHKQLLVRRQDLQPAQTPHTPLQWNRQCMDQEAPTSGLSRALGGQPRAVGLLGHSRDTRTAGDQGCRAYPQQLTHH